MRADPLAKIKDTAARLRERAELALVELSPEALPAELAPVEALPMGALPDALRPWVEDVTERMQCPPDFVAVPLIVAASTLAARVVAIRLRQRDDWTETANLWAMIIGRPGVMKTPAMRAALAPLEALEASAAEAFNVEVERHKADALTAKLRAEVMQAEARNRLRKDRAADISDMLADIEGPSPPGRRRYLVNAPTWQKLHAIMAENPGGLLMVRDELSGWLHDVGREEQAEARSFFVFAWSGGNYTLDTIGRGTVTARDMRLGIIGAIQPGPVASVMRGSRGSRGDDGLIERFLVSWPDDPGAWRDVDRLPDGLARQSMRDAFTRLNSVTPQKVQAEQPQEPDGTTVGMPFLRLSEPAREAFSEWRADLEAKLRKTNPDPAESALAKYRHHVPALALTLHLIDGGRGPVTEMSMLRALALGDYFQSHTRRLHGSGRQGVIRAARLILAKARAGDLGKTFTARDVYRPGWTGLTERELVQAALDLLVSHNWLTEATLDTGGRPSAVYSLTDGARHEQVDCTAA